MSGLDVQRSTDSAGVKPPLPLCWAGATSSQQHLNLGDALSPVMVALMSGRPIARAPFHSSLHRLSAVGTIGHALSEGVVDVWGSGSSASKNPQAGRAAEPYTIPAHTQLRVHATRGPLSWALLTGAPPPPSAVFGDPVWLLPRFYRPAAAAKWELGIIMHLSEHHDRNPDLTAVPLHQRYAIPADLTPSIKRLDTITAVSAEALRQRMDDILACKRIVSTSLHGMVIAESYGIPCLYFPPRVKFRGLGVVDLADEPNINSRFADLYLGLGLQRLEVFAQRRNETTDWDKVIGAIDQAWHPKAFDAQRLMDVFPAPLDPVDPSSHANVFSLPLIRDIPFRS